MKAVVILLLGAGLLLVCYRFLPRQEEPRALPVAAPVRTAAISLERLLWLREQHFPTADRYLQEQGWKFISKQKQIDAQEAKYNYTSYKWAYSNPALVGTGDTLVLAKSKFPFEMGMLNYNSPGREEYDRVWAAIKARHFPYSNHSGPAKSNLMIFEGPHQDIILSIRPEEPGQKFQIGIEYRDPKVIELLPPPMSPKRVRL